MDENSTQSPSKRQQNEPIHYANISVTVESTNHDSTVGDSKRTRENGQHLQSCDDVNAGPSNRMSSNAGPQPMEIDKPINTNNIENIAEVVLEAVIDIHKKSDKKGIENALRKTLALRNSCGGVVKLKHTNRDAQKLESWKQQFIKKESDLLDNMGEENPHAVSQWSLYQNMDLIFVRKSATILTEESNLLKRLPKQKKKITSYGQIKNMFKSSSRNTSSPCKCHTCDTSTAIPPRNCLCKDFFISKGLSESKCLEFKNFPDGNFKNFDGLKDKVKENVVAFSNTDGGTLYVGVKDDGEVVGQLVEDEELLKTTIQEYIAETKCVPYSKQSKDLATNIICIPVQAEPMRKVIAIDICKFGGTVFLKQPKCPTINKNGEVVDMPFKKWILYFKDPAFEDQQKFDTKRCGLTVYKEIKGTMDTILQGLGTRGRVKVHPKYANKWINNGTLDKLLGVVKVSMTTGGHVFVQRCWNALLSKPNLMPPPSAICDVLLCSPKFPLVMVTLVDLDAVGDQEVHDYNSNLAKTLKIVLAQEADCMEEFLVKPLVISAADLNDESIGTNIFSLPACYPPDYYSMTGEKYSKIMESLALVLTRVNSSVSIEAGLRHYATLTKEQYDILEEYYGSSSKVKITGLPGTGKTLLALERIKRLRMGDLVQWDEVLFVCSNKCLEAKIRNHQRLRHDGQPLCKVVNCCKLAHNPNMVYEFKHIVLDEVHNYAEKPVDTISAFNWWQKVTENKDCIYWFFLDKSQRITKHLTVTIPKVGASGHLKTVIRTTGSVYNFFKRYLATDTSHVALGHDMQGSFPEILIPKDQSLQKRHLELENILLSILYRLIVKQGHFPKNITVLFSDRDKMETYKAMFKRRAINCPMRTGEQTETVGVKFETIRRYSGDESPIVIGFCPKFYRSNRFQDNKALMASLCSRPLLELYLVFETEKIASFFGIQSHEWKLRSPPKVEIYDFSSNNEMK